VDPEAAGDGDGHDGHPDEGASNGAARDRLDLYRYATALLNCFRSPAGPTTLRTPRPSETLRPDQPATRTS
jgi:hypothetical protein